MIRGSVHSFSLQEKTYRVLRNALHSELAMGSPRSWRALSQQWTEQQELQLCLLPAYCMPDACLLILKMVLSWLWRPGRWGPKKFRSHNWQALKPGLKFRFPGSWPYACQLHRSSSRCSVLSCGWDLFPDIRHHFFFQKGYVPCSTHFSDQCLLASK